MTPLASILFSLFCLLMAGLATADMVKQLDACNFFAFLAFMVAGISLALHALTDGVKRKE